jgi:hypothetical protein
MMTNRRELLKVGLAAAAFPVAAGATLVETHGVPLYKVLYDTRFPASVTFGRRAEVGGLAVRAMTGDMTPFWYDDLYHRWKQGPVAIAGLTGYGALFCLERLAWEQRMRVVYRGEHTAAHGGCVAHRFEGPDALLSTALDTAAESGWAAALADVIAGCPASPAQRCTSTALTTDGGVRLAETLFSWVIAPVARA